jgi:hypothetical protein
LDPRDAAEGMQCINKLWEDVEAAEKYVRDKEKHCKTVEARHIAEMQLEASLSG